MDYEYKVYMHMIEFVIFLIIDKYFKSIRNCPTEQGRNGMTMI